MAHAKSESKSWLGGSEEAKPAELRAIEHLVLILNVLRDVLPFLQGHHAQRIAIALVPVLSFLVTTGGVWRVALLAVRRFVVFVAILGGGGRFRLGLKGRKDGLLGHRTDASSESQPKPSLSLEVACSSLRAAHGSCWHELRQLQHHVELTQLRDELLPHGAALLQKRGSCAPRIGFSFEECAARRFRLLLEHVREHLCLFSELRELIKVLQELVSQLRSCTPAAL